MLLWLQDQCGCHVTVKGGNIEKCFKFTVTYARLGK